MEIADLSELCRLCLDTSPSLFPFNTVLTFTKRSLPQLIKFCVDVDCTTYYDGGIAPKNICQACLDKLQIVFEFRMKSHESDKYLKQIISHSVATPSSVDVAPSIAPYESYTQGQNDDENSLLEPLHVYQDQLQPSTSRRSRSLNLNNDNLPGKGNRHGEYRCDICIKTFKYIKPFKTHMKTHGRNPKIPITSNMSYYMRKKLEKQSDETETYEDVIDNGDNDAEKEDDDDDDDNDDGKQPDYDSRSPYNSPAPFKNDQNTLHSRDSSPDFGALMLSTSQYIGHEVLGDAEKTPVAEVNRSKKGRPLKRTVEDDDYYPSKNGQKRTRISQPPPKKLPSVAPSPLAKKILSNSKVGKSTLPTPPIRKPGPLSTKIRSKTWEKSEEDDDCIVLPGFSEVDISKVLKKSKKNDVEKFVNDNSNTSSHNSNRSRTQSRSPSVELIPEVDIF